MMDLTVEIHGDIGTLEEALHRFTATEILDGDNKYHCGRSIVFPIFSLKYTFYNILIVVSVLGM